MIPALLSVVIIATNSLFSNLPYPQQQSSEPILHTKEESFNFSKFLENNWVVMIAFVVFLIRLQNSVEDIKKDNKNQIDLIIKDFEVIKTSLFKLQEQINNTANKKDLEQIKLKQKKLAETLYRLIEFINENNEQHFKIKEYNVNEDD